MHAIIIIRSYVRTYVRSCTYTRTHVHLRIHTKRIGGQDQLFCVCIRSKSSCTFTISRATGSDQTSVLRLAARESVERSDRLSRLVAPKVVTSKVSRLCVCSLTYS